MVEGLDGLRLDAVVRRHDQDRDVGHLGASGTHGGERLVTGGVDERDRAVFAADLGMHLVGADVLCDATGLTRHHIRGADRVEHLGLAVVDVTHDGDNRRTRLHVRGHAFVLAELEVEPLEQFAVLVLGRHDLDLVVEFLTEQLQGVVVDTLSRVDHLAELEHDRDEIGGTGIDAISEIGQG